MKSILKEIKKFRKLTKLNESNEFDSKVVLIGDDIAYLLYDKDFEPADGMINDKMTIDSLIDILSDMEPQRDIDHVFVSIGKNDKFNRGNDINYLSELLNDVYPNAKISAIKSIVDEDYLDGRENDFDIKSLEKKINNFYDKFERNGIDVIGNYESVDYDLGYSDVNINNLKKTISDSIFQNQSGTNFYDEDDTDKIEDELYHQNIDIYGDDETDFDTIYEFLNRFQEIHKSKNVYSSKTKSSFGPDIEQIQIALKFLLPNSDLEITGKYDLDTEETVHEYQEMHNLEPTGICDNETIEDILFNLKVKGFDDNDLAMFIKDELGHEPFSKDGDEYQDNLQKSDELVDSGKTSKKGSIHSEDEKFYEEILDCIGAPDTDENKLFFYAWRQSEGAKATFNPFNTTQPFGDDTKYNSVGVRNYETEEDGIKATCKTLKNGRYPCIVGGLKSDIGAKNIAKKCIANLKTWGTGGLIFKVLNRGGSVNPPAIARKNKINILKKDDDVIE